MGRKSLIQSNNANLSRLHPTIFRAICKPAELISRPWGLECGTVQGPFTARGGSFIRLGSKRFGASKSGSRQRKGFLCSKGSRRFRHDAWEFVNALQPVWSSNVRSAELLMLCSSWKTRSAKRRVLNVYRASSQTPMAARRAKMTAESAFQIFQSGQGRGVCGFDQLCEVIARVRHGEVGLDLDVLASEDRFLRTGNSLALAVLRKAGVTATSKGRRLSDNPHFDGQERVEKKYEDAAERLAGRMLKHIGEMFEYECMPTFDATDLRVLPGLEQTLSIGSSLDWVTTREAGQLLLDPHKIAQLKTHASFRCAGASGSWLVAPGFRDRVGMLTTVRPILVKGYEKATLALLKIRFPRADFLNPIVLPFAGRDLEISEANVRTLEKVRSEQLLAIDHASLHWGSAVDLDLLARQNRCGLRTVFPSTYASPFCAINAIKARVDLLKRIARRHH